MKEEYKQHKIKMAKSGALAWDIVAVWLITVLLYMLFQSQLISLTGFECAIPYFEPYSPDGEIDSWAENVETFCESNFIVKMGGHVMVCYLFIAALFISSSIRATPVQYLTARVGSGLVVDKYYTTKNGKTPLFHEALHLLIVSRYFFPLFLLYIYFVYHDFKTGLYHGGALWATIALVIGLKLYEQFNGSNLSWDERFSGLRVNLTKDAIEHLEKQASKSRKWCNRFFYKIEMFFERTQIGNIIFFAVLVIFTFNFVRDINPPENYDEVVYQRTAPVWNDNAYFALAGLDAPQNISDFYEYGRQRVIFHAERWADFKNKIPVPYVHDVPKAKYTLFMPYEPVTELKFDKGSIENWDCLYDFDTRENISVCPSMQDIMALRDKNTALWQRFLTMADYKSFSKPDHFMDKTFDGSNLISLAQLHAAYLVHLQSQGQTDKAVREWIKYTKLYKNMVSTHSGMVMKAVFLVVFNIHKSVLEVLLYNDPTIALSYKDEIEDVINIQDVSFFRAGDLIADDWRELEPIFLPTMGMGANQKRKMMVCFSENQELATMSAEKYMNKTDERICMDEFPDNTNHLMLRALADAGNPVANLIHYLLMGGVLKGDTLIKSMHHGIADFQMAKVAMELISNNINSRDAQHYLDNMPQAYWNPITEKPFLWDQQKGWLYYPNTEDPSLEPNRMFRVNLK